MAYDFIRVFLSLVLVHQLGILFAGGLVAKSGTDGGKGQEKGKVKLHDDYVQSSGDQLRMVSGTVDVTRHRRFI